MNKNREASEFTLASLFLFVLVRTLLQPMYELNVNTFCSVSLLALGSHHPSEKEILCFLTVFPYLFSSVADGRDLACSRHKQFRNSIHKNRLHQNSKTLKILSSDSFFAELEIPKPRNFGLSLYSP